MKKYLPVLAILVIIVFNAFTATANDVEQVRITPLGSHDGDAVFGVIRDDDGNHVHVGVHICPLS